jgi:hypothetical protein
LALLCAAKSCLVRTAAAACSSRYGYGVRLAFSYYIEQVRVVVLPGFREQV